MEIKRLLTSFSNRILIQFGIVIVVVIALVAFNFDSSTRSTPRINSPTPA